MACSPCSNETGFGPCACGAFNGRQIIALFDNSENYPNDPSLGGVCGNGPSGCCTDEHGDPEPDCTCFDFDDTFLVGYVESVSFGSVAWGASVTGSFQLASTSVCAPRSSTPTAIINSGFSGTPTEPVALRWPVSFAGGAGNVMMVSTSQIKLPVAANYYMVEVTTFNATAGGGICGPCTNPQNYILRACTGFGCRVQSEVPDVNYVLAGNGCPSGWPACPNLVEIYLNGAAAAGWSPGYATLAAYVASLTADGYLLGPDYNASDTCGPGGSFDSPPP